MSDISTTSWSEVDASNNTTPPEGWPAGMFANAVEPTARMNMGAMKRFWNRVNPVYAAVLSTTDTFTVTETQARAGYSLYEKIATRFPSSNLTTSPTVNHSALGAQLIKKWNGAGALANVAVGDVQAQEHEYYWDGTQMVLLNPAPVNSGAAKAWVQFSSTGAAVTINASFNIASVVRNGAGDYTITFTNAFSNANYAAFLTASRLNLAMLATGPVTNAPTVTAFRFQTFQLTTDTAVDPDYVSAVFIGT